MNNQNIVSTRFTPAQADTLRVAAEAHDVPVSTYIREAALREELRSRPGTQVRQLPNGAELLWWSPQPHMWA